MLEFVMANPTGEIGRLREEELPVVRVIVPPDPGGRVFEDDLDPGDLVFDSKLTPMLVWHERYPVGRGWRSGWVLSYDTDGNGNSDDYIVGLALAVVMTTAAGGLRVPARLPDHIPHGRSRKSRGADSAGTRGLPGSPADLPATMCTQP